MPHWIKVAKITDFQTRRYKCIKYLAKFIAVIKDGNSFYAIEGGCRHQHANLFSEGWNGGILTCPRHGWQYDMTTGRCLTEAWANLRRYPLKIEGENILVTPHPIEEEEEEEDFQP